MINHDKTNRRAKPLFASLCTSLMLAVTLAACSSDRISTSVPELNEMIQLQIPVKSAKWEVFHTPESGGLPAPTDYITLVAEVEPADAHWFPVRAAQWTKTYAIPEAARGWMAEPIRAQLGKLTREGQTHAAPANCKDLQATMTRSGRSVPGFVCAVGTTLLVYVTLQDNTGASSAEAPA